jgi:hypothetical protein
LEKGRISLQASPHLPGTLDLGVGSSKRRARASFHHNPSNASYLDPLSALFHAFSSLLLRWIKMSLAIGAGMHTFVPLQSHGRRAIAASNGVRLINLPSAKRSSFHMRESNANESQDVENIFRLMLVEEVLEHETVRERTRFRSNQAPNS